MANIRKTLGRTQPNFFVDGENVRRVAENIRPGKLANAVIGPLRRVACFRFVPGELAVAPDPPYRCFHFPAQPI